MFGLFKHKPKSCVGVDIGTSSIKVVQLRKSEERYELETYGELQTYGYLEKLNDPFQTKSLKLLESQVVEMLTRIIKEAEVNTKQATMSIPVFSSFISVVDLPPMSKNELSGALTFEARRYVPVPLGEVRVDWQVIGQEKVDSSKSDKYKDVFKFKVLLIAVPKEIINKHLRIAKASNLNLVGLELESFSYIRSLLGNDKSPSCILDMGARSTSFTIVDKGFIQGSHSLDIAGTEFTKALSHSMGIDFKRAEAYKREKGLNHRQLDSGREIRDVILVYMDKIIVEAKRMLNSYQQESKRKVGKLVLSGGSANLIGLEDYLAKELEVEVIKGNPWSRINYLPILKPVLQELAPRFAVAVGSAMRGL